MKRLTLVALLLFSTSTFAQLSGIITIPGNFPSIASAISSLNAQGVGSGGVTFDISAGYTETFASATVGLITATGTSSNPIVFQKSGVGANPVITAGIGVSSTVDGIIVIKGGDYITFDGIDLIENAANTTSIMKMEWGYAVLKSNATDGAKNINISNCTITLNKLNTASIGIYANNHTEANTTQLTITDVLGTNQNIKINGNTVSNCYQGIYVRGSTTLAYYDSGLEIGSTTGNNVLNYGGSFVTTNGIFVLGQNAPKIENNTITLAAGTTTTACGINVAWACIGDLTINLNRVSVSLSGTTSQLTAINNLAAISTVVNITNNTIENCTYSTATTGTFYGIYEQGATTGCTVNITGNTIKNNTLGSLTTAGSGSFYLIYVTTGAPTAVNVNNNVISGNINAGTTGGTIRGIYINKGTTQTTDNNNIFDNSIIGTGTGGTITGIYTGTGTAEHKFNNIYNNSIAKTTATGGYNYGISNSGGLTNLTYNSNNIYNLTSQGTNTVSAICEYSSTGVNTIVSNVVYGLSSKGNIYGLSIGSSATTAYKNKIYNLSGDSSSSAVYGIYIPYGANITIYNNFISDLKAPVANSANAIAGIYVSGTGANLYYNTIYLNATSTGALFGTSGIYASTTPTLDMRNNIIVNTSIPMGVGYTAAYRRSAANLTTHAATSNFNCFYAGIPAANNVIFYDGTTAYVNIEDITTTFGTKEDASFWEFPPFEDITTAPYNLKIQSVPTGCESGGQKIVDPPITDDFEGTIRFGEIDYVDSGTATDVGADEFTGTHLYSCVTPVPGNTIASANALCTGNSTVLSLETFTVGSGVNYQWQYSTDGVNYTDGQITATWTVSPNENTYYRCIVTCMGGPVSVSSIPVHVTFAHDAPTVTPNNRCGPGNIILGASATSGTLKWYTTPTGGASVFTGSPYNAYVSSTTTYYVAAESTSPLNVTIGAGALSSATDVSPFSHSFGGKQTQCLIKGSELAATGLGAGNLTSLSFNITSTGVASKNFELKVGSTSLESFNANFQSGLTTVYSADSITPTIGVYTISFITPYYWDGISNIIVQVCWSNINNGAETSTGVKYDNTTYYSTLEYMADWQQNICGGSLAISRLNKRPQMLFSGQAVCSSLRTPVIATVDPPPTITVSADQTVCNNAIASISVISDLANYDTYTWTPETDLYLDAAATVPYVAGTSATSVYAKSTAVGLKKYICTGRNAALCEKKDSILITVLPANPLITAVSSPICGSGTSALNVTPSSGYGAATFQWNISSDNVSFTPISGHTTRNDVSAVITATTYYSLSIKDGAGTTCAEPTVMVEVVLPQVVSVTPVTRCGPGFVTVSATGSDNVTLRWYNKSWSGMILGTGTSFTAMVNRDTIFYVEASHNLMPACICSRTPVNVSITPSPTLTLSSAQTVCNNAIATINITSTLADYDTYTWTPVTDLYTDANATVPYVTGTSATTVYVKSAIPGEHIYSCYASNTALCGNIATSTILVRAPINIRAIANPLNICSGESSILEASINHVCDSHKFSSSLNTYTPLVGGTISTASGDEGTQLNIPIGFNFTHVGVNYSTFSISTNGAIKLGATSIYYYNSLSGNSNVIAPMWDDNNMSTGTITYQVTGIAPNRVLTVEWDSVSIGGDGTTSNSTSQFQVQLFEGSNNIMFNYGALNSANGLSASIGISASTGQFLSVTPAVNPTVSTTTANNAISSVENIPSGTSYLFTPFIPSYSYSWKAGALEIGDTLTTTVTPISTTDYTFIVEDENSCRDTSSIVSVSVGPVLVALEPIHVTCNGGDDGSFTEGAIACGTAPFTYSVDGSAYGAIPSNLAAGNHTVIVKDAGLNLSAPVKMVINQPSLIGITEVGSPIVINQGATTAVVSATANRTTTVTLPFNVTAQPAEVNSSPGSIIASATLPTIPIGSTITNVTLSYPGIIANFTSWQTEVYLGLSGAVANAGAIGTGTIGSNGTFNYTKIFSAPVVDFAGGLVNLLYYDSSNDVIGADTYFPLGNGAAILSITYSTPATVTWYDAAIGGNLLGTGTTLEAIGTNVLPNGNTPGTYNFYAEGSLATCVSPTRAIASVTISAPPVGGTATASVDDVCYGTGTTILLTGNIGNIQWQSSTDGTTWNTIAGETTATLATGNLTAKTYYQAVVTSGTYASTVSTIDSVGVIAAPIAGTLSGDATVCSDANSIVLTLTGYTDDIARWESSMDGTTWAPVANTTDTYTATNLTATTHFRAVVENGICSINTNAVIVTVTPLPTANIAYVGSPFGINVTTPQAVTLVGTPGGVYSSTIGLTIDASNGAIIPSTSTIGTYVVTYTIAAAGGCGIVTDTAYVVINAPIIGDAPTALMVSAINSSGASLNWINGGSEIAWNIRYKKTEETTYDIVNNITTKPYLLTGLQANTTYVWNVQAVCSKTLNSEWSEENVFTTTVGIDNNSLNGLSVYSYNKEVFVINNCNIQIKAVVIYDLLGQEVGTYAINSTDNVLINSNLTIGNYVVKVITETKVGNYKLFIK